MMILSLDHAKAKKQELTGGKGSSLARLMGLGFAVPPGFVVTTGAFSLFLENSGLKKAVEDLLAMPGVSEAHALALQRKIKETKFPEPLSGPLEEGLLAYEKQGGAQLLWAVRSSALAEDLENASFAGQYDTFLGLSGFGEVSSAVLNCWASFFNPHALAYRKERGIREHLGAVVVQTLINPDAAGVCFSMDPVLGDREKVVINANFGLGESVVSGLVSPDTFVLDKKSLQTLSRDIQVKDRKIIPCPGGTEAREIGESLQGAPCIDYAQAQKIAGLAVRVERSAGGPVDIEWALVGEELYLLQSRPVTVPGRAQSSENDISEDWEPELQSAIDPSFPLYSNGNISEVLPGCITPLSWSFIAPTIEHAFRAQGAEMGSMKAFDGEYKVLGFFFHRPYICVSFMEDAARRTPGMTPDAIHEEFIGPVETPTPPMGPADFLPHRWPAVFKVLYCVIKHMRSVASDARACEAKVRKDWQEASPGALAGWTDEELLLGVRFTEGNTRVSDVHIWASAFAVIGFAGLRKLTQSWLGDGDGSLAARMVTGIGSLPSADPAYGLESLAEKAKALPQTLALFTDEPDNRRLCESLRAPEHKEFLAALEGFLRKFGHRAVCEAEFHLPCWREDPSQVLGLVRNYLLPGNPDAKDVRQRQDRVRREAADAAAGLGFFKRALLRYVLKKTRENMALREELKDLVVLRSDRARRIYAEIARRLTDRGFLETPGDICFLIDTEVKDCLMGGLAPDRAREIIRRRKQDYLRCQQMELPKIMEGKAMPVPPGAADKEGRLAGMPVSPGTVRARARVILDPRQDARIEPGEILVAPVTDAGWTPLFLNAGGLVVEVGGLLSHGSVVAREYGIPAVVAVKGATRRIRTGDLLLVDGARGTVSKIDEE